MPFPFRTPATEEWTPPDYAVPVKASTSDSGEEWTPPSYATPVKKEEKKGPSVFSRAIEALKPAKTIKPTGSLLPAFLQPSTEPIPYESDEEKAAKKSEEKKGFLSSVTEAASKFLSEHPKIREAGQRFLTGTSPEFEAEAKKRGITDIQGPGLMKIPGVEGLANAVREKGIKTGNYYGGVAGSLAADVIGLLEGGFDPRTAGIKGAAKELPIRQSREIPYRMEAPVEAPKPIEPIRPTNKLKTFMKENPEATMADIEEFTKSVGEAAKPAEIPKEIPKVEAPPEPVATKAEEIPAVEAKKPFVSPFEKKAEKPLEQTFGELGGVGHPDEPGYINKVLARAGSGEPGLAVEPVEGLDNVNHVVYRNKDGEPIAAAMVVKDQSGKTLVQDLAADKSKGLLTGRAMKALGGKLEELGATESSGTMSPDAQNFLNRMKSRAKAPETEWKPPEYAKPIEAIPAEQRQRLTDLGYTENTISRMTPQEATNLANSGLQASKGGYGSIQEELSKRGSSRSSAGPVDSQFKLYTPEELRVSQTQASSHNIPADWGTGPLTEEERALLAGEEAPTAINASGESAASQEAINRQASMKAKGEQYVVYDRAGNARPLIGPEAVDYQPRPGETFGIITPTRGFRVLESRGGKIPGRAGLAEFVSSESGGMRWEGPVPGGGEIFEGPQGRVLNKLFNALEDAKGRVSEQADINRVERARRFAASASVKEEGAAGAAKSLSKLRGEFEKVNPGERLQLDQKDTDSLFTAIKRANITESEKDRGYAALFKLLTGEKTPVRSDLQVLNDVFGNGFGDKVIEMHGGLGMVGLKISKLASTMKSMQNAFSLAPPVRHGVGLMGQRSFYPAARDYFKFYANKEFYNASMKAIEEHPDYLWARDAGLYMPKLGNVMNSEEEFLNSYIGNVPKITGIPMAVGASQRSYNGLLVKARFDTLNSWKKMAEGLGHKMSVPMLDKEGKVIGAQATPEAKKLANFINIATGRGDLGSLNKLTNELNTVMWSPRMVASRIQMLNPKLYMDLPKGMRLEGLKSLFSVAALGASVTALTAAAGAKISNNILSTDFMKSRFGKHVIDPWGGFQQYIVAATRFLAGKTDSPLPASRLDIAGRFLKNKESPIASLIHTILTAKAGSQGKEGPGTFTTQYGQPTSIQRETVKSFEPIFIQDIEKLVESEPDWSENVGLTAAMAGASLAGMAQEYPEKKTGKLGFRKMKVHP